jgi:RNase H-fold protein (predicted Holliday junction resolvase)
MGMVKGMGMDYKDLHGWHLLRVPNLHDELLVKKIKRYIDKNNIGYVVIDTKRSHFGGDENSVQDTTIATQFCNHIKTELGVTVKLLHHTLKSDKKQFAGSDALKSNCDVMIIPSISNEDIDDLSTRITLNFLNDNNKVRNQRRSSIESFNIVITNRKYIDEDGDEEMIIDKIYVEKIDQETLKQLAETSAEHVLLSSTNFDDEYTIEDLKGIVKMAKPDWKDSTVVNNINKIKDELFEFVREGDKGKKYYKRTKDLTGGLK